MPPFRNDAEEVAALQYWAATARANAATAPALLSKRLRDLASLADDYAARIELNLVQAKYSSAKTIKQSEKYL